MVGRVSLGGVPGRTVAAISDDVGVVAGEVVPDDHDALGVEPERRGAFDGPAGAVAGLADTGDLFGVLERDCYSSALCGWFEFRGYAAACAQASCTARISSGVG